jgi:hypothetical protein
MRFTGEKDEDEGAGGAVREADVRGGASNKHFYRMGPRARAVTGPVGVVDAMLSLAGAGRIGGTLDDRMRAYGSEGAGLKELLEAQVQGEEDAKKRTDGGGGGGGGGGDAAPKRGAGEREPARAGAGGGGGGGAAGRRP